MIPILVLLAGAAPLSAQARLELIVEVRIGLQPLANASVRAGRSEAVSDSAGRARLQLSAGDFRISARLLGYAGRDTLIELRSDTTIVLELMEEAVEEEAIVVLSTRGERRIEDEPLRVEVVGREEVEEKLLMTPGSIAMLLNETAGLRVQEAAPSLGGANVRIQGLRGKYTQLLVDGLPIYGGQTGSLGLLQIPPMDVQQVEVIKGAASALYGASALGGVVNLISRRPAPDDRELLLNATTQRGGDVLIWLADSLSSRWGYTFLGGLHAQNRVDVDDDEWTDIPRHRRGSARARVQRTAENGSLMLTAGLLGEQRSGGGNVPAGVVRRALDTRHYDVGGVGRLLIRPLTLIDLRGTYGRTDHTHAFESVREDDTHWTGFGEASVRGSWRRHEWVLGAALAVADYSSRSLPAFNYRFEVPSVFAQDEIRATHWLTVSVSGRVDAHNQYGTFLNPRAALLLRASERWSARWSAGTGYFAPTPFTDETEEVGLSVVQPLGDLSAEKAQGASLDLGWHAAGIEVNGTLFGSRIEDALGVRPDQNGRAILYNRTGQTRTWGTELLLHVRRPPLAVTASHVFMRSTEVEAAARRPVPLTPRHSAGVVASLESEERGRASVELYYVGRQLLEDNPFREGSEPYLIVGMLFEARLRGIRAFLNLENLTDVRLTDYHPFVRPSRGPLGQWTTDAWAPREGRVFNGGLRIPL